MTSLAQPWPLALTIDYVLTDNKPLPEAVPAPLEDKATLLAGIAFLIVLIFTVNRSVASFRRYLLQKLGQETVFDMREALYAKVHALGLDYHGKKRTGDTITRVTSDVKEVRTMLVDSVVEVFSSVMILLGMLVVMLWLDWQLTLLALVTVPFLFLAVKRYRQALVQRMRIVRTREGAIASVMQEAIIGIRAVKLFAREDDEMERFRKESWESLGPAWRARNRGEVQHRARNRRGPWYGAGGLLRGEAGPVRRPLFGRSYRLRSLPGSVSLAPVGPEPAGQPDRHFTRLGRAHHRPLERGADVKDLPGARPAPEFEGRVTFEGVRFAYENEAGEVLRGMDFDVEAGAGSRWSG